VCGKRKAESEGRTPEEEEAGEELTVLASGASVGSSLWLLSCLGGRGTALWAQTAPQRPRSPAGWKMGRQLRGGVVRR
jgi:hypothetical protein